MSVKLRLQRFGRKKRPFYRIVAVDSRKKRDGAYIESVGHYNPLSQPAEILIDEEKALKWLDQGAQPSDTVRNLLSKKGILLKRSLASRNVPAEQVEVEIQKWDLIQQEKRSKKKKVKETPSEAPPETLSEAPPEAPPKIVEETAPVVEVKPEEPVEEVKPEEPVAESKPEEPVVEVKSEEPVEEAKEPIEEVKETVEPTPEKEETPASTEPGEPEVKS